MRKIAAAFAIAIVLLGPPVHAQTLNTNVLDPDALYNGRSYADLSAAYWQWVYSLPADRHPLFNTADVSAGQSGDVWFLGGAYASTANIGAPTVTVARNVSVLEGQAIFLPLIAAESSVAERDGSDFDTLLANSQRAIDAVDTLSCSIDGVPLPNLGSYRVSSDAFNWGPLPANNVFRDPTNYPAGETSLAASDGYFLLIPYLSPGDHSIHFTGGIPGFHQDVTYNLTVMPINNVFPPNSRILGKTYSQWAAAFMQFYMSRPAINNPFFFSLDHPFALLSDGQSGPVWFVHGYRNSGGTYTRTATIPEGTFLFLATVALRNDNADCPNPDHYTPAQLLGGITNLVNGATGITAKLDDVSLANLASVRTNTYRTDAIFNYTSPPGDNMIYYEEKLDCYTNSKNIFYTITNAVSDGIYLMIPPLSQGFHTLTYTLTLNTGFSWDMTENLIVVPATPPLAIASPSNALTLSWPQSSAAYSLETTTNLENPDWQPANLPVNALPGIYQVTAPLDSNHRFYRLRSH